MRIKELLQLAIDKQITYSEAIAKLKDMKLPYEEQEDYEIMLHKLLGDNEEKLLHNPVYSLKGVPNEWYLPILNEAIKMVRTGSYSPEVCQHLYDRYLLDNQIMLYFLNEAISIVRMNTLAPEEVANIGEAYYKIKRRLEIKTEKNEEKKNKVKRKKPVIEVQTNTADINADQADEICFEETDDYIRES